MSESASDPTVAVDDAMTDERRRPRRSAKTAVGGRDTGVVSRAERWDAVASLVALAVLGVAQGWIWSLIAPPEWVGRVPGGQTLPLIDESYHRFDDLAVFLLMGLAAGLVSGVAAWLLPRTRGPVMLLAIVAGSLLASWLAARTGLLFAGADYPPSAAVPVGVPFAVAPRLESSWALIGQPLAVAATYGALAAWNARDDLGRDDGPAT